MLKKFLTGYLHLENTGEITLPTSFGRTINTALAVYDDTVADYCRITVIATGLNDDNLQQTPFGKRSTASSFGARRPSSTATTGTATAGTAAGSGMNMPSFSLPTMNATPFGASKTPSSTVQKKDIQIPDFLRNR